MALKHVIRYLLKNYPYKDELSKTRLTKMVYLADWFSVKKYGRQLTDIKWYFDHYGPYVSDVFDAAERDKKIHFRNDYSAFGTPKLIFTLTTDQKLGLDNLSNGEIEILDEVIQETKYLNWSEFIDYVYSTYPIKSQRRYNFLNLVELANEENRIYN